MITTKLVAAAISALVLPVALATSAAGMSPSTSTDLTSSHSTAPGTTSGKAGSQAILGLFTNYVDEVGAGVHTCPSNGCTALEVNPVGTKLEDFCYFGDGQPLGGTDDWDLVFNRNTRVAGWTNEHWLFYQNQGQVCADATSTYPSGGAAQPGAGIHSCWNNTCPVLGLANGHLLIAFCYTDGQSLGGTVWWDLVYDVNSGIAGWTNEAWLANDATNRC